MKLPEAVIEELREIDIPYGKIIIFVNEMDQHVDVCVEDRKRFPTENKSFEKD